MSAHPFQQGAPLDEYCEWLIGKGGSVEKGENEWGSFKRLIAPNETDWVIVAETEPDEALMPSVVDYLDSRLGISSPWHLRSGDKTD